MSLRVEAIPENRRHRLAGQAVGTVVGVAALGTLWAVDPSEPGHFPPCPFRALTGWWCPACGGLRAAHALLHGDVAGAMAFHPLVLAVAAFATGLWVVRLHTALSGRERRSTPHPWVARTIIALLVIFTVLRNLPGWTWLSPA